MGLYGASKPLQISEMILQLRGNVMLYPTLRGKLSSNLNLANMYGILLGEKRLRVQQWHTELIRAVTTYMESLRQAVKVCFSETVIARTIIPLYYP